jgi:hypothetical protein
MTKNKNIAKNTKRPGEEKRMKNSYLNGVLNFD